MGFADDVFKFRDKALLAANKGVSLIAEEYLVDNVMLSPTKPAANFATGLLKNSWFATAGGGFDTTVGMSPDPNGTSSLSSIKAVLAQNIFLGTDNTITLTNSVDHAYRANYLGWPSGESANGWHWSGKVQAYAFVQTALANVKGRFM